MVSGVCTTTRDILQRVMTDGMYIYLYTRYTIITVCNRLWAVQKLTLCVSK